MFRYNKMMFASNNAAKFMVNAMIIKNVYVFQIELVKIARFLLINWLLIKVEILRLLKLG